MPGFFEWKFFKDVNLDDPFFDSLREDYKDFNGWFLKKSNNNEKAMVYEKDGIRVFVYLKRENIDGDLSPLIVDGKNLPLIPRLKIGTLKLDESIQGQRIGEGAIGTALWYWQNTGFEEVYVTVFSKHRVLIDLLVKFGFMNSGKNSNGEEVYIKSRINRKSNDPYALFPYIFSGFQNAKVIPINDYYHDKLYPYSELQNTDQNTENIAASNGITKVFIATPFKQINYEYGTPVFIYRIHTGNGKKSFKSVITSFCTITKSMKIKNDWKEVIPFDGFVDLVKNKSVFDVKDLRELYNSKNVVLLEMVYNGFFGAGKNVNYNLLKQHRLFEAYPYEILYTQEEFKRILRLGGKDDRSIIAY